MIDISITYTDIKGPKLTFDFADYRFKKRIEEALEKRYRLSDSLLPFINVEVVADDPALHHLVTQVDWGFLYDRHPEIISYLFHVRDDVTLIKILWLHVTNGTEIMEAADQVRLNICSVYEDKQTLYQKWLNKYSVHPDVGKYINMHHVLEDNYPTIEVLKDGSVIVLNW